MFLALLLACRIRPELREAPPAADAADPPLASLDAGIQLVADPPVGSPADTAAGDPTGLATGGDTAAAAGGENGRAAGGDTGLAAEGDTAAHDDTGPAGGGDTAPAPDEDSGDSGLPPDCPVEVPLEARLAVDVDEGEFPLVVRFDGSASELGARVVRYAWSFGDGARSTDAGTARHTYVGEGEFEATLTLVDDATGETSRAEVTIEVDPPACPHEDDSVEVGQVDDASLDGVSGIVASRVHPDVLWIQEDAGGDELIAIDPSGFTLSEHELPNDLDDVEDLASAIDPATGRAMVFLADIGDNGLDRDEVVVWVLEEPDPYHDGDLEPLEMELTYPDGPVDAETLLVDPWTLDLYLVTKTSGVDQTVYRKRAPHDDEGPFELEDLGTWSGLDFTATGGDVSPDGQRIVVRGYDDTARLWYRDGYRSLEEVFDEDPCEIDIAEDDAGEAITFALDGTGVLTTSEGSQQPIFFTEL